MAMEKEIRENRYTIRFTESEARQIEDKMKLAGVNATAAFIRAMILNGYILRIDLPEIREMIRLLSNMTNNLNQIAKRLNAHGHMYETEIEEIQQKQNELWQMMRQLLTKLDVDH